MLDREKSIALIVNEINLPADTQLPFKGRHGGLPLQSCLVILLNATWYDMIGN
jgi:hypothetical protein